MQIDTEPGETIEAFSPDIPNPQFFEHVMLIMKLVSANLGIPLMAVLLDATQTNFSGWRGAMDQARAGWRALQKHLIRQLSQTCLQLATASVYATSPEAQRLASQPGIKPFCVKWQRPTWEYIEPVKDTTADIAKIRGLISSPRRIHARRGEDFDEVSSEIIADNATLYRKARDTARELNGEAIEDTEKVTWREMLVLPLPDGLSISLNGQASDGSERPTKETQEETDDA